MHQGMEGAEPQFLQALDLTESELNDIDRRTSILNLPNAFSRKPRSLKEKGRFKANEYRDLIFYGIYAFHDTLSENDFDIWCLLTSVLSTATKDTIDKSDITALEKECPMLISKLYDRFGPQFMTYNIHLFNHYPRTARLLGNLTQYCAFMGENDIGRLVGSIKGSYQGCRELANNIALSDITEYLAETLNKDEVPRNILSLIDEASRTTYHASPHYVQGCCLLRQQKDLQHLRKKDYAAWKCLYDYLNAEQLIEEVGWLTGHTYQRAIVQQFCLSSKSSSTDSDANSLFYVNEKILKIKYIASMDNKPDAGAFFICQKISTLPGKPFDIQYHVPCFFLTTVSNEIEVISGSTFSGIALKLPGENNVDISVLLPSLLYQID